MPFNCNLDLVADGSANILDHLESLLQIVRAHVMTHRSDRADARPLSNRTSQRNAKAIPGPDLHCANAALEQVFCQFARATFEPRVIILVLTVAYTGIVNENAIATAPA